MYGGQFRKKKRKLKHTLWFSREALKLFSRTKLHHDFLFFLDFFNCEVHTNAPARFTLCIDDENVDK